MSSLQGSEFRVLDGGGEEEGAPGSQDQGPDSTSTSDGISAENAELPSNDPEPDSEAEGGAPQAAASSAAHATSAPASGSDESAPGGPGVEEGGGGAGGSGRGPEEGGGGSGDLIGRGELFQQSKEQHDWAVLQKRIVAVREREVGNARVTARNWRHGRCSHKVVAVLEDWVRRIRFSGEIVAVGLFSGQVSLRSLASHAELARFKGHPSEITALDFDGTYLVAGSDASVFLAWDATSSVGLTDLGTSFRGHTKAVTGLQLDGPEVISSSEDGTVRVWQLATGECLHVARAGYPVRCVARDGELLVMGLSNGTAIAYSMSTQKLACSFQGHSDSVNCLQYNALARRLLTGSSDGTLRLWDSWTGQCVHTLQGHMAPVVSCQFDDAKVVSAARDGSVRVWDAQSGKNLYSIQGHTAYIGSVQYDATRLITDGMNNVVICHDFSGEEEAP